MLVNVGFWRSASFKIIHIRKPSQKYAIPAWLLFAAQNSAGVSVSVWVEVDIVKKLRDGQSCVSNLGRTKNIIILFNCKKLN